jgi:hypothetical protein
MLTALRREPERWWERPGFLQDGYEFRATKIVP